jgi:hypothetical protein
MISEKPTHRKKELTKGVLELDSQLTNWNKKKASALIGRVYLEVITGAMVELISKAQE